MQRFTRGYKQCKPCITHTLTHRIAHLVAGFSPRCVFRHIETQYTLALLAGTRLCDDADCCLRPEGQISSLLQQNSNKQKNNKNTSIFNVSQSQNHLLYYNTFIIQPTYNLYNSKYELAVKNNREINIGVASWSTKGLKFVSEAMAQ